MHGAQKQLNLCTLFTAHHASHANFGNSAIEGIICTAKLIGYLKMMGNNTNMIDIF
jgi:hypothetical protein